MYRLKSLIYRSSSDRLVALYSEGLSILSLPYVLHLDVNIYCKHTSLVTKANVTLIWQSLYSGLRSTLAPLCWYTVE